MSVSTQVGHGNLEQYKQQKRERLLKAKERATKQANYLLQRATRNGMRIIVDLRDKPKKGLFVLDSMRREIAETGERV